MFILQEPIKYEIMAHGARTGVYISAAAYNNILGETQPIRGIRHIGRDVFPADVLAAHSALGRRSPYPALGHTLEIVKSKYKADMVSFVMDIF
jgi:hypothetical protein